jgi:putative aldouronate transport system permease protein
MFGIIVAFENFQYPKGILHSPFAGLENFRYFFGSATFIEIVRNTILYNVAFVVLGTVLALAIAILAFMVRQHRILVGIYQLILFLPYFLSFIVIGVIVQAFLSPQYGLVTHLVSGASGSHPNYYAVPTIWIVVLVAVELWQTMGFSSLLYYTGLLGIDPALYEAAETDGASRWQVARYVLIPSLAPLIGILLILAIGGLANANFALFYFVPNNSPLLFPTTDVINTYVFRALTSGEIGPPAAVGLFQSVVGLVLVLLSNFAVRRINPDASLF